MKICWYFDAQQTPLWYQIARRLENKYDLEHSCGVVIGEACRNWLLKQDYPQSNLALITEVLGRSLHSTADVDYLRKVEKKYGNPNLWLTLVADRVLVNKPKEEILKALEIHFRFYEEFLDKQKPQVMISGDIASLPGYACYLICREGGIPYYQVVYGRMKDRVAIIRNLEGRWERVESIYEELKKRPLSSEERQEAERFIADFRKGFVEVTPLKSSWSKPKWGVDFARLAAYLRDHYLVGRGRDYFEPGLGDYMTSRIMRLSRFYCANAMRYFEEPVPGEPYVFFPLHFQPEASTMVRGPFYLNQVALVENLARSLPIDHYLYVKEHPRSLGTRPLGDYRTIRRLPNVRLIGPFADGYQIIRDARAVAIITGTAGWEGLILGKPVVTFGKVFYNVFENVYTVGDVYQLPSVLFSALNEPHPDEELLIKFVSAYLQGTRPGEIANPQGRPVLTEENIANLAGALAEELGLGGKAMGQPAKGK